MLEFVISIRDLLLASLVSWFGQDVDRLDGGAAALARGAPLIEISVSTCPPSRLEEAIRDASGA